ncbi:hypothetical protein BDV06DRAFT_216272 [Aspergillus oleicola]
MTSPSPPSSDSTPCKACTWTPSCQIGRFYKSHVKIFYECSDRGLWSLGSQLILKDRGARHPSNEVPNVQFVENASIPVPDILESWEEDDGHKIILMRRVPGVPLAEVWPNLSSEEKENIARQTAESLLQLRKLQSDKIQSLDGGQICDNFLFHADRDWKLFPTPFAPGLKTRCHPRNHIHPGDLTDVNITVDKGCLSGIIDWEHAGYLPVWWEYVNISVMNSEDKGWKALLRKHMPDYIESREWWRAYYWLCRDAEHEVARGFIEETEREGA